MFLQKSAMSQHALKNNVRSKTCLKGAVYCAAHPYTSYFLCYARERSSQQSRIIISLSLQSWLGLFCLGQPTSARRAAAASGGTTSQGYIANRSSRIHFAFETQAKFATVDPSIAKAKLAQSSQQAASSSHQFCLAGILFCSNNALS